MCGNILSVFFFWGAFSPVNILSVGVQILEPNRFFLTNILSSSPALYYVGWLLCSVMMYDCNYWLMALCGCVYSNEYNRYI